jgi:hypothetical protein
MFMTLVDEALLRSATLVKATGFTQNKYTRLENPTKNKHSSLSGPSTMTKEIKCCEFSQRKNLLELSISLFQF